MTFEKNKNLAGQIAVVTGANGKIARGICKRLSELGAIVYGITRIERKDFEDFLISLNKENKVFIADITDSKKLKEIAESISACDILVNCVGRTRNIAHSDLESLSDEEFDNLLKINLRAVFATVRSFFPLLKKSQDALVINISSASSIRIGGSNVAYAAAKAGLDSMTRNLAIAFAPQIRFIALNPATVDTGFVPVREEHLKRIADMTPLKRIATVEDVANAVEAFAVTMRFTTGNCFVIDGGRLI